MNFACSFYKSICVAVLCGASALFTVGVRAQNQMAPGTWRSLLSAGEVSQVQEAPSILFASSGSVLFSVEKDNSQEIKFIDREQGASDVGVQKFAYDPQSKQLLVYYHSGMIDVITEEGIYQISALYNNTAFPDKHIHQIYFSGDVALLAGNFGLAMLSLAEHQVMATAFVGRPVFSVAVYEDRLFALTEQGAWEANMQSNIQDPAQWEPITQIPRAKQFLVCGDRFVVLEESGAVVSQPIGSVGGTTSLAQGVRFMEYTSAGCVLVSNQEILLLQVDASTVRAHVPTPRPALSVSCNNEEGKIWWADGVEIIWSEFEDPAVRSAFELDYQGPSDDRHFFGVASGGRYFGVGGARATNRYGLPGSIKVFDGVSEWINFTPPDIEPTTQIRFSDMVSIAADPQNKKHFFVGSWGEGLYEFRDDRFYERFSLHNSALSTAVAEDPTAYVRVGSLCFAPDGILWMAQGSVEKAIAAYNPADGGWYAYHYPEIAQVNSFGPMVALPGGAKCVAIYVRGGDGVKGLFVFDERKTLDTSSDDKTLLISQLVDRNGKAIAATSYEALAVDQNGTLWVGTNRGPVLIHNAGGILNQKSQPVATRPVGGAEPNLYYVMDNIYVTAIAVDGVNNKWVGTQTEGLYLLAPDGSEVLAHYTTGNSPLLSNSITCLALDSESGTLYIGTSLGLMAYQVGGSGDFNQMRSSAHVYPNPVPPYGSDLVTITGLNAGTLVRVLDLSGALLYETTAVTSDVKFYARDSKGQRWAGGVYQVLLTDPSGKKGTVLKFAVIN